MLAPVVGERNCVLVCTNGGSVLSNPDLANSGQANGVDDLTDVPRIIVCSESGRSVTGPVGSDLASLPVTGEAGDGPLLIEHVYGQ